MKIVFEEIFPEFVHSYGNSISIPLVDTDELNGILDEMRVRDNKRPLFNNPSDFFEDDEDIEYDNEETADVDGYYDFRLILDIETGKPVEIEGWLEYSNVQDDDAVYHIEIDDPVDVEMQIDILLKQNEITLDELRDIVD